MSWTLLIVTGAFVVAVIGVTLFLLRRHQQQRSFGKGIAPRHGASLRSDKGAPSLSPQEMESLERSRLLIHGLMMGVSESITSLLGDVSKYNTALDGHQAAIKKAMTLAALQEVERVMLAEVDGMRKTANTYYQQLRVANEKLQKQQQEMARLSADAAVDFLTRVPNRRTFDQRLKEEFARFKRDGEPFSLVILDIDYFKQVNDNYGHIAGDRILRATASILKEAKRESDILARYGGEEFVFLLPDTLLKQGVLVAEKARQKIAAARMNYEGKTLRVNLSAGVAQIDERDSDPTRALARADEALYRAKQNGRNRVECTEKVD